MTLEIEIRLKADRQETILAHEQVHTTGLTHTQTVTARRLAATAIKILAGDAVLGEPLAERLRHQD